MNHLKLTHAKSLIEKFLSTHKDELKRIGLTMGIGRCSYNNQSADIKITIMDSVEINGTTLEPQAILWHNNAEYHRMEKDWIGKSFNNKGYTFTIVGWKPKARKQPVQLKRNDGKSFKCSVEMTRKFMIPEKVMAETALNKLV